MYLDRTRSPSTTYPYHAQKFESKFGAVTRIHIFGVPRLVRSAIAYQVHFRLFGRTGRANWQRNAPVQPTKFGSHLEIKLPAFAFLGQSYKGIYLLYSI